MRLDEGGNAEGIGKHLLVGRVILRWWGWSHVGANFLYDVVLKDLQTAHEPDEWSRLMGCSES